MADQGHWYTDKNGNHYFVKNGETPKEGWERSKRRKMIDGGKYKVDDGDGKGSREVSMEEYNKYEADDDFDETTDDDFGFDEEEEYGNPRLQANADVVSEMMERGINVHDEGAVLDFLDGENYEEEDKREIVQYIRSMVPEDEEEEGDESEYYANVTDFNPEEMSDRTAIIENVPHGVLFDNDADMRDLIDTFEVGITGDPEHGYTITGRPGDIKAIYENYDLQNEKLDINFRDGAWEPQGEDEEESLENTDNRGEGANPDFNREKFGKYFNSDGTLKKGMEDEYFAAVNESGDNAGSEQHGEDGRSSIEGIKPGAITYEGDDEPDISYLANQYGLDFDHTDTGGYSVRGRHQDVQKFFDDFNLGDYGHEINVGSDEKARIEQANKEIEAAGGKNNPAPREEANNPQPENQQPAKKQHKAQKTDDQKKAAMKAKAKAKRDKEIQSMGKEIVEYYNGDPIDEDEVADILGGEYGYNQRMVNAIIKWVKENQ